MRKISLLSSWATDRTAPVIVQEEACAVPSFSAARTVSGLLALDMGGVTDSVTAKLKAFLLFIESSVKASWFHTSGQYAVHGWLHSNNIASHGSTARGRGQMRWSQRSLPAISELSVDVLRATLRARVSCTLGSLASRERQIKTKLFIATRESRRLHLPFLYSTWKRQARRNPSTPATRCETKFESSQL